MRISPVFQPQDFRPADGVTAADSAAMFATMFPGVAEPAFDADHAAMAVVAVNPALALQMRAMSAFMLAQMPFGQRAPLRELAIQVAHRKLGCNYGFRARLAAGRKAGLTDDMLMALPDPRADLFDEEQQLVIRYAGAVVDNAVDDGLLAQFTEHFCEKAAIECAALVGMWSCWSMVTNVAQP